MTLQVEIYKSVRLGGLFVLKSNKPLNRRWVRWTNETWAQWITWP